ncbi:MAG: hypothetical protein ACR2JD_08380 [Nocardioides sp.]
MIATTSFAWGPSLDELDGRRVTQCALSRICGSCGTPLGRPIAFVGTAAEVGRNAFHAPPLHVSCGQSLVGERAEWSLVTTAGFEFVRPGREDDDRRPTFWPNSLLSADLG